MIDLFPWNDNFKTGIDLIDAQHKVLVTLVNELAVAISSGTSEETLNYAYQQLEEYADMHFKCEEAIWKTYFSKRPYFQEHLKSHDSFISGIKQIKLDNSSLTISEVHKKIITYLSRWLVYHILDDDLHLSGIVLDIQNGMSLEEAEKKSTDDPKNSKKLIIATVMQMYEHLCMNTLNLYQEITKRKEAEKKLEHMAQHDTLTNLPNRRLFNQVAEFSLKRAKRSNQKEYILFIDIDNFKPVNDKFGHDAGDELLQQVSERLQKSIRRDDLVARHGGDEFLIQITNDCHIDNVNKIASEIINQLTLPFHLTKGKAFIGASIGISIFPEDGQKLEELIKKADQAMYQIKTSGKNNYLFYKNINS